MPFGRVITNYTQIASNGVGSLVMIGASESYLESIDKVYLKNTNKSASIYSRNSTESLTAVYDAYASLASSPLRYAFEENVLTLYTTHYDANHRVSVIGKRKAIPIKTLDDYLDIDDSDLELFVNYVIREAAQIRGKQIPPSVARDIISLENRG